MRIRVQKIPRVPLNSEEILAKFCYYFPQYKFSEAKKLPFRRVMQMLKVVRKEQAIKMHDLVQIVASPHTKDGKAVSDLLNYYKSIIEE